MKVQRIVAVMLSLFAFALTPSPAEAVSPPKEMFFRNAEGADSTTSLAFVDLPSSELTFTTTGQSMILVEFFGSGGFSPGTNDAIELRGVINGTPMTPSLMRISGAGFNSLVYSGAFPPVGPGVHTVKMQWRVTGATGFMRNRMFIVWVFPWP